MRTFVWAGHSTPPPPHPSTPWKRYADTSLELYADEPGPALACPRLEMATSGGLGLARTADVPYSHAWPAALFCTKFVKLPIACVHDMYEYRACTHTECACLSSSLSACYADIRPVVVLVNLSPTAYTRIRLSCRPEREC